MKTLYRPGDFNLLCDRCGKKIKRSRARMQWNNLLVCYPRCYEERQPQQHYVRGVKDQQRVADPRPEPETDDFVAHKLDFVVRFGLWDDDGFWYDTQTWREQV